MGSVKLQNFGGMLPVQDERILPENMAAKADGVWLYSGALKGLNPSTLLRTLAGGTAVNNAWHIPNLPGLPAGANEWVETNNINSDLIKAPVISDQFYRYYLFNSTSAPTYNTLARIRTGAPWYTLGIPTPSTAPTVTPVGGTGTALVRAYLYTWLSAYSEEGAPSPATLATGHINTTSWTIGITPPGGTDTTGRNLTTTRIYRTVTGTNGVASFFFVADVPINTTSYSDTLADTRITGGTQLPTTIYSPPPTNLQGAVAMPNGMLAGWTGNDIWFSEPFLPHAWPAEYTVSVEYPVIGLGVIGTSLVVCTEGYPQVATGNHPSVMSFSKIDINEPCASRKSIVSTIEGVYYVSPNGLIRANPYQVANITRPVCDKQTWQNLLDPPNTRSVWWNDGYIVFSVPPSAKTQGVFIDPTEQRISFLTYNPTLSVRNIQDDLFSPKTLFLSGNGVYDWDSVGATPMQSYIWKSKKFQLPFEDNLASGQIFYDTPTGWNGTLPTLKVYAGDRLVLTRTFQSGEVIRLPSGFKESTYQFEVNANVTIHNMKFATSTKELRT
jgi:hypothetical protein